MIDVSAVARVVGIDVKYEDLRGGAAVFLPQHVAVFAQGSSSVTYPTTKWAATSAGAAGNRYGFGSPIHQIVRQLLPSDGDGVGSIPVTVYPLTDAPAAVAAAANIVPSGTTTAASEWRVRVAGVLSAPFVIPKGVVNVPLVTSMIGNAINSVLEQPVKATFTYGTVTSVPAGGFGANVGNGTCSALSVVGTPAPGVYRLACTSVVLNGGVFSMTDPQGTVVSAALTMAVPGPTVLVAGGIQFTLTDGSIDFAVGDGFNITVPAGTMALAAKWKGTTGNDLLIEMIGDPAVGVTFVITQPAGGLVDPDVVPALGLIGEGVWVSMIINGNSSKNVTALDAYRTFGESRWNELVRKPLVVFTGTNDETFGEASAISSTRNTDRVNSLLAGPGSPNMECVVAANQVAKIVKMAQNNPPTDYGSQRATRLIPGPDGVQWNWATRDLAVKAGCSTTEVKDGVVCISDVVTFYRPTGEEPPAYAFVVDIVKLQQVIFNIDLIFSSDAWNGMPLIPDDQPTVNPNARKPKAAVAAVCSLLDSLALNAIISDAKTAKARTKAWIDSTNPKRLNIETTVQLAGNTNIIPVTLKWGFFFGSAVAA